MPFSYANVPNRVPLMSHILRGEGALTADETDHALRTWFARRKEGATLSFAEIVIGLGYMRPPALAPYLALQRQLAAPPQAMRYLGVMLLQNDLIKPRQLAEALMRQRETGKRLGELLVEEGTLKRSQLAILLRLQGRRFTNRLLPHNFLGDS